MLQSPIPGASSKIILTPTVVQNINAMADTATATTVKAIIVYYFMKFEKL